MRHLIDSCDRYIPFCLIVIFTVVSLCVCFNVFYLICHNNNNNTLVIFVKMYYAYNVFMVQYKNIILSINYELSSNYTAHVILLIYMDSIKCNCMGLRK